MSPRPRPKISTNIARENPRQFYKHHPTTVGQATRKEPRGSRSSKRVKETRAKLEARLHVLISKSVVLSSTHPSSLLEPPILWKVG